MAAKTTYQHQPPGFLSLYSRAILPRGNRLRAGGSVPSLSASLLGVSTHNENLKRYQRVCGFPQSSAVPITWPHILAFPLHLQILTRKDFPLPLLGLVHLHNTITQHRPIGEGELLDIHVCLSGERQADKGLEFDLVTEAYAGGRLIWEEVSTNLYRQPDKSSGGKGSGTRPEIEHFDNTLTVSAPERLGRQYGKISGDLNLIHLHAWTAKAFGFPRAIAHGMWSKAYVLAQLEQQAGWKNGPVSVSCQFKTPLYLPGSALLEWRENENSWYYQLLNSKGSAPHLSGTINWS